MDGIEIATIMLLIGFLGGVMAGIVVIVSVASRREDRNDRPRSPDSRFRG